MIKQPRFCEKRNGSIEPFDKKRITNAINKAFNDAKEGNIYVALEMTETVVDNILRKYKESTPTVEGIQDTVEEVLMENNFVSTTRAYITYRFLHNKNREIKIS